MTRNTATHGYDHVYASFRLSVPPRYNWARDVLDRWATQQRKLAMLWVGSALQERRLTFSHFAAASRRFANVLRGLGVTPGQSLFVMLPRIPEWWEVVLGALRAGVVWAPATTMLTPRDIQYRVTAADARVIVTDAEGAAKIDEFRDRLRLAEQHYLLVGDEPRPRWMSYRQAMDQASEQFGAADTASDDPAMVFFTSGTTGPPKMVLHTHASYPIAHTITGRFWLDNGPTDLHWTIADTGWAQAAWTSLFAPWTMGAGIFVHDDRDRFNAAQTLALLEQHPITTFFAPPTAYRMLIQQDISGYRLQSLRHVVGAGEPLNPEVIDRWYEHTGLTIHDGYGQTETVLMAGMFPTLPLRKGSMGKAAPGYRLGVVDEEGQEVMRGEEGVLAARVRPDRPVGLFAEYWKDPQATADRYIGDWYVTGDRARMDEDGYLWFVGRDDDVIISSGYRIGPFEVESVLLEHPAVAEAAVIAAADPVRGSVVKAFVSLAGGWEPSAELVTQLQQHVASATAPYKYPRAVEFVSELPKTVSGKIQRAELRRRDSAGAGAWS